MMRSLLAVAMTVTAIGCGTPEDATDAQTDVVEDAAKADTIYPTGTFTATAPKLGDIADLTLDTSPQTFSRVMKTVDCLTLLHCNPVETGTYKFTHSGSTRYIRFYDSDGNFTDRVQWKLSSSTLSVREVGTTAWQTLHAPAKANACTNAGGSCVALAPGTCDDGAIGDATQYSCGGGLGVECCLPKPAPTGPACKKASDCTGPLPHFCRLCDNGSTACAHYACEQNHCTLATCE